MGQRCVLSPPGHCERGGCPHLRPGPTLRCALTLNARRLHYLCGYFRVAFFTSVSIVGLLVSPPGKRRLLPGGMGKEGS